MIVAAGLVLVVFGALAQVSILPQFSIFGAQPIVLLVLLVAWMVVRGRQEALLLIPAAGFAQGLLDSQPLGLAMLAFAPLILMTEVRGLRLVESDLLVAVGLTVLATVLYEGILLFWYAATGDRFDWRGAALDALLPAVIANVLVLLPVYGLLRLTSMEPRRRLAI